MASIVGMRGSRPPSEAEQCGEMPIVFVVY